MTTIQRRQLRKLPAVSAILGMVIGIGITAALGGGVYYVYQEQADLFSTGSNIEVRNVSVLRTSDGLSITGTMKNIGATSISKITIEEIRVSDLRIIQDADGVVKLTNIKDKKTNSFCWNDNGNGTGTSPVTCRKLISSVGFTSKNNTSSGPTLTESTLEGGRSNAFKLTFDSGTVNIKDSVRISDTMTLILKYQSGSDVLLSEPYTARVRAG